MKNLKRFLTVVFSLALTLSLWFTGAALAKTAKAEGAKTYDISEVYTDMAAGGELSMVLKTVYGGNAVNYGDAVEFEYKMRSDKNEYGHYARSAFGIGSYGIFFYCSADTVRVFTADIQNNGIKRASEFASLSRTIFTGYNKMSVKADKTNDSTVTFTLSYTENNETKTVTKDFAYDALSDMKLRFGDSDVNGNFIKSTKAAAEPAEPVTYDITEVYPDLIAGNDLSMAHGTVYTGNEVKLGDTVKFVYKMNAEKNPEHYARSAFAIGAYGIYFYCSSDAISIRPADLSGGTFVRGSELTTINRLPFSNYNELTLKAYKAENSHVMLVMTYHEDGEIKSVSLDYGDKASPDMKFRFGDGNIDGNVVKSTIVPPVFGDGSFTYSAYVEGVNVYGGCNLSVIASEKAAAAGVPEGFTGNVLKMSNADKPGQTDMALDFSALNYKRKFITGLSFRIYIVGTASDNAKHPEFRIPYPGKPDNWVVGGGLGANKTDEWITVSLTPDQLDKICIDGYLKTVAVCLRTNAATTMYIDKIELTTIEFEHEPPVISAPVTEFKVTEGAYPVSTDKIATVTDNSGEYFVSYEWSEGALDDLGRLRKGTHTCKVIATDRCDNVATLDITYIVEAEPEITLYKITFKADGADDIVLEYCEDEIEYIELPAAPEKAHYKFEWEAFTFEKNNDQIVRGVYIPEVYTITYVVGYDVYTTVTYTAEDMTIDEPRVPAKKGYEGKWEEYYLDFTDVTVRAIYTRKTDKPTESESSSESESDSENETASKTESEETSETTSESESHFTSEVSSENPLPSHSEKTDGGSGSHAQSGEESGSASGCFASFYGGVTALGALAAAAFIVIRSKKEDRN